MKFREIGITFRLTLLFGVLSAAVLAPAGWALQRALTRSHVTAGEERAGDAARNLAATLLGQLDKDLLVEFEGQPLRFDVLRAQPECWAVATRGGELLFATQAFAAAPGLLGARPNEVVLIPGVGSVRVGRTVLAPPRTPRFEGLPTAIQETTRATFPGGAYLAAGRNVTRNGNLIEVLVLHDNVVHELKFQEDGTLLRVTDDTLPDELDAEFLSRVPPCLPLRGARRLFWRAFEGQLLAVLEAPLEDGGVERLAINRLGERFLVDERGEILGKEDSSTLEILVAQDASREEARIHKLRLFLAVGCPTLWLGLVLAGWYVARRAMSPVEGIVQAARAIRPSDLTTRIPAGPTDDELARIARTINEMLDRLATGYERERRFTGDASHELRNPLTKIRTEAEVSLGQVRSPEEYQESLRRIVRHSADMTRLVESLLFLARLDGDRSRIERGPFDLPELVEEVVASLKPADSRRVELHVAPDVECHTAVGQRGLCGTAIHNLLENAVRYSPPGEPVEVRVSRSSTGLAVEIEDRGPGIAAELREKVFDRFFRIDPARSRDSGGFGLGLSLVRAIADALGGTIQLSAAPGGGTIATLVMPAA